MKKIIVLLCYVMHMCVSGLIASTFTIEVPQILLEQNSSLMVYMIDQTGHQRVGKCQLDSNSKDRKILQNELEMTTVQEADSLDSVVDLMDSQVSLSQDVVILHFEFDNVVKVLRILVVKNSFLEDEPFDIFTLPLSPNESKELDQNHHAFQEFENDLDALSALVENVSAQEIQESSQQEDSRLFRANQYMLYAEIYMLMQYGRLKRAVHNMTSWFCS